MIDHSLDRCVGARPSERGLHALAAVLLVAVLLAGGHAAATVVVAKDFAALCNESDLIFVGTVAEMQSRWSDPTHEAIETLVTFADLTWLRGGPQPSLTLRFSGGEMDGLREEIAGVPHFAVGERRVIFAHDGRFVSPIVGFDQGALRVVDGADGAMVIGTDGTADTRGALRLGTPGPVTASPEPLDAFLNRVRSELAHRDGVAP